MRGGIKLGASGGVSTVVARTAAIWALVAAVLAGGVSAASAETPYEPNDAVTAAAGPLLAGQSYTATIESAPDRDFYAFYVTSPAASRVELTVQNLGGGGKASDIDATILDATATPVASQAFIRDGETRTLVAELGPQKYFVEVTANEGFGDSYVLTPSGGTGAFAPYAQISGRCARATTASEKAERGLRRAKARLQHATARLRRSRYALPGARQKAQASHRAAKRRVRAKRMELRTAQASTQPWCSIAP